MDYMEQRDDIWVMSWGNDRCREEALIRDDGAVEVHGGGKGLKCCGKTVNAEYKLSGGADWCTLTAASYIDRLAKPLPPILRPHH